MAFKPYTEAMARAMIEYERDAMQCCDSCWSTAHSDPAQIAFAHGWIKAMKFAHKILAESTPNAFRFDREDLMAAFRAHAGITEQAAKDLP